MLLAEPMPSGQTRRALPQGAAARLLAVARTWFQMSARREPGAGEMKMRQSVVLRWALPSQTMLVVRVRVPRVAVTERSMAACMAASSRRSRAAKSVSGGKVAAPLA